MILFIMYMQCHAMSEKRKYKNNDLTRFIQSIFKQTHFLNKFCSYIIRHFISINKTVKAIMINVIHIILLYIYLFYL